VWPTSPESREPGARARSFTSWTGAGRAGSTVAERIRASIEAGANRVSHPCDVHHWTHPTEPCPDCREIDRDTRRTRRQPARFHERRAHELATSRRAEHLTHAITAAVRGDVTPIELLFTPDVVGSGPGLNVSSRDELTIGVKARRGELLEVEIAFAPLEVGGRQAAVEWVASGVHAGPVPLEPTRMGPGVPPGHRVRVRAVTVAEFEDGRICSFRSYWDDLRGIPDRPHRRAP
jgi:ketosteroid isomerase-like protein